MRTDPERAAGAPDELRTPHVALDAEVFRREGYNFATAHLTRLRDHARAGRVWLYVTDVTDREVRARIRRDVREAADAVGRKLRDATRVLHTVPAHAGLAVKVDADAAAAHLEAAYDVYRADAGVTVVSTETLPAGPVLAAYFAGDPPFGGADKKSEFPDAFTVAGLAAWCGAQDATMYVVSGDGGVRDACRTHERLIPLTRIGELLDILIASAASEAALVARARAQFDALRPDVIAQIEEEFPRLPFDLDSDEYADVAWVAVNAVRLSTVDLASVDEESADFDLSAVVEYTAHVSYDDPDATYYDRKDDRTFVFNRIGGEASDTATVPVVVRILLGPDDPARAQLDHIEVGPGREVAVSLREFVRDPDEAPDED